MWCIKSRDTEAQVQMQEVTLGCGPVAADLHTVHVAMGLIPQHHQNMKMKTEQFKEERPMMGTLGRKAGWGHRSQTKPLQKV